MNNNEKLFLDKISYEALLEEIELLKKELAKNGKEKADAYSGSAGDGWHDNFAFDEANRQERMILGQLKECYRKLEKVEIVEKTDNQILIDLNDIVAVNMIFSPEDNETIEFKLVGAVKSHISDNDDIYEISINSPLGKSVYHKKVGDKVSYKVENEIFNIEIISKTSEKELKNEIQKKKIK